MCIMSVYAFLKVAGYYDVCDLSMSAMGFQKSLDGWWVGEVSSIQIVVCDFWNLFNFAKLLKALRHHQCS